MKVCIVPGCGELSDKTRCPLHRRADRAAYEAQVGDRHQQGYGQAHRLERKRWIPRVASGKELCARCNQRISPLEQWHLDHTDDRTSYLGASHAACNTSAPHRGGGPPP